MEKGQPWEQPLRVAGMNPSPSAVAPTAPARPEPTTPATPDPQLAPADPPPAPAAPPQSDYSEESAPTTPAEPPTAPPETEEEQPQAEAEALQPDAEAPDEPTVLTEESEQEQRRQIWPRAVVGLVVVIFIFILSVVMCDGEKDHASVAEDSQFESPAEEASQADSPPPLPAAEASSPAEETFTVNGVSFTMVKVEGGEFTMGATPEQGDDAYDGERPTHQVTLSSYYIGQMEVTQALWRAVMGDNPSDHKGDDLPVENVSWDDCQAFIRTLNENTGRNFRLPTEAEWEYAARGGKRSKGYKYAGSDYLRSVAWFDDNSEEATHPVGTKNPNELGLYDMSGNVWEWCQDWYGDYEASAQTNPVGSASGSFRVNRGGGWNFDARGCRVSGRFRSNPSSLNFNLGLRLVL